jgi:exodeoxyribonuclease VII large subunit
MGPESVLKRGYAILLKEDGAAVRRPDDVLVDEDLTAKLSEGAIDVKVVDK